MQTIYAINNMETQGAEGILPASLAHEANREDLVIKIMEHIKTEVSYYHSLLLVLQQERDILLSGLHDELLPNCELKLSLGEELNEVQKDRQQLVSVLRGQGHDIEKMIQLLPWLEEELRPKYRTLLQEADLLARRLQDLNQINRTYINEALDSISHILAIFADQQPGGYNARGGQMPISGRRLFAKEV